MVQGLVSNKAKGMTRDRAMEDPKKAFGALSKLAQKMNPQQLQQLQQGMGDILGRRIPGTFGNMEDFLGDRSGLNLGDKAAETFSSRMTPQEFQELNNRRLAAGQPWSSIKDQFQTTQAFKAPQIHQLLANMGFTGPGSGMTGEGPYPSPGLPAPGQPGNPIFEGPLPGPPPTANPGPYPSPGLQPPGPMPGGPGVMGQPSMPGGMQPPVRVNNPGTFFGGQQPQQPPNQFQQQLQSQIGNITQGMPQAPMLNPGTMQGPMGMSPTMGQQPAAPMNNPQYGGMGIR